MNTQVLLCGTCTFRSASRICYCGGRDSLLCEECFYAHNQGTPFEVHLTVPIHAYGQHGIQGYFDRLETRSVNIPLAKKELLDNIRKVDEYIAEVERAICKILASVSAYKTAIIENLRKEKRQLERRINEAILEVERTMQEDAPILNSQIAIDLRECQQDLKTFQIFKFKVDPSKVLSALESICIFWTEFHQFILPGIYDNTLWLYDVKKSAKESISLPRWFVSGLRLCFIKDNSILVVGSSPPIKDSCVISLPDVDVAEIQPMQAARRLPGLIAVEGYAYVFGGECVQCEKLNVCRYQWSSLPNLKKTPKPLSPILHNGTIYLIGAVTPIEVFSLASQTFQQIAVDIGELDYDLSCFEEAGEVVIITNGKQVGRWKYDDASIRISEYFTETNPLSQCPTLLLGRSFFFVSWKTAHLYYFDLDNNIVSKQS